MSGVADLVGGFEAPEEAERGLEEAKTQKTALRAFTNGISASGEDDVDSDSDGSDLGKEGVDYEVEGVDEDGEEWDDDLDEIFGNLETNPDTVPI